MRVVLCNLPSGKGAWFARQLVDEGLVACANLIEVRSIYRWEKEICDEAEDTLLLKVSEAGLDALRRRVLELHPYDLPEFLALGVDPKGSHGEYLDWVRRECGAPEKGD